MPILENQRHEEFARGLAKGLTSDEAYQQAGFKANRGNATRLKANESVRKRVLELQATVVERTLVTIESLTEELEAARNLAMADEKGAAAAVAAVMGKAKLHGYLVDKREVGKPGEFADMSLSQKQERAIGLARQLGLSRLGPTAGSA
jgi:hypothetical protein